MLNTMTNDPIFFLKRISPKNYQRILWTAFLIFIRILMGFDIGSAENFSKIAVIVSLNIKPYAEALEGIHEALHERNRDAAVFFLENYPENRQDGLKDRLIRENYDTLIGVGPEASRFIWTEFQNTHIRLLYSMVLHPEQMKEAPDAPCGISMSIPVRRQIDSIARVLPQTKRIGLLFDPAYNQDFFAQTLPAAAEKDLGIIPLSVSSRKEIPRILEKNWDNVDCLWMIPDRTIISESIIQFIIKEALLHDVPVIGYNRFFWESGAVLSFIFDYKELGKQTGALAGRLVPGEKCPELSPGFQLRLNEKVLKKLGTFFKEPEK